MFYFRITKIIVNIVLETIILMKFLNSERCDECIDFTIICVSIFVCLCAV